MGRFGRCLAAMLLLLGAAQWGWGQLNGALAAGSSAGSVATGGAVVAGTGSVLDAVEVNPAGLAGLDKPALELGGVGALAYGQFTNSVDPSGQLRGNAGAFGYGAFGFRIGESAWRGALAATPEDLIRVSWRYADPPGTAGASYGLQTNRSKLLAVRPSFSLARSFGPHWTAGGTLGLIYNQNTLQAPFIFQEQPQLRGLKVLLNLKAMGWGWNGAAGAQWQPVSRARFGVSWKSAAAVQSHGSATGTAAAQFAALGLAVDPNFRYGAEVDVRLPQSAAAGIDLQAWKHTHLRAEGDWTGWHDAFRALPVKLTGGTNPVINTVAGSNAVEDVIPLAWRNQGGIRLGMERPAGERWAVRGGYAFQSDPVPSATLTPLTAAILRNTFAAGGGWKHERLGIDAAYQAQLPATRGVGQSALLAGEYDNSRVRVWTQIVTVTTRVAF